MNLRELVQIWQRYWALVVSMLAVGLLTGCGALLLTAPEYTATARLFVSNQASGSATDLLQGSTYTQSRVESYAAVATLPIVLDAVIEDLDLDTTSAELATRVSSTVELDSLIINLSAEAPSAEESADLVNAVATSLSSTITGTLERPLAGRDPVVTVTPLEEAAPPAAPSWPSIPLVLVAGGFAGILLGVGLALILNALDQRVRQASQAEALLGVPLLGTIPRTRNLGTVPLIEEAALRSSFGEAVRALRTNLTFVDIGGSPRRIILVTSSVPGEGKSTISLSLAASLAAAGKSVILVDADLRVSRLSERLGLEAGVGLTDALLGRAAVTDLLQPIGESGALRVLASGRTPPNPAELLASPTFDRILQELHAEADYVVLDAPPVLPVADSLVLARAADAVLFVVGSALVKRPQLTNAKDALQRVHAPLVGVVVNLLAASDDRGRAYGYESRAYVEAVAKTGPAEPLGEPLAEAPAGPDDAKRELMRS